MKQQELIPMSDEEIADAKEAIAFSVIRITELEDEIEAMTRPKKDQIKELKSEISKHARALRENEVIE